MTTTLQIAAAGTTRRRKSSGRRDLRAIHMQEERVEILDPSFDGIA